MVPGLSALACFLLACVLILVLFWLAWVKPLTSSHWRRLDCPVSAADADGTTATFRGSGLAESTLWRQYPTAGAHHELQIRDETLLITLTPGDGMTPVPGPYLLHKSEVDCVCVKHGFSTSIRFVHQIEGFREFVVFTPARQEYGDVVRRLLRHGYRVWTIGSAWACEAP